jgi:Uncharacterized protein conserved in bacteria (DUF2059)
MIRSRCALSAILAALSVGMSAPATAQPASPPPVVSPSPEALALGRSIVDVAFPPATRQALMEQMMSALLDQMKQGMPLEKISDPGLRQIVFDHLASVPALLRPTTTTFLPRQMDAVAQAYARMFSLAELKDILAFARTPSGRSFLARSSEIMGDPAVTAVNVEYFRAIQAVKERVTPELSRKMEEYVKAHPDAMPRSTATEDAAEPQ